MRTRDAVVLAAGVVLAAATLGGLHYQSRQVHSTIRVTGAATQPFDADVLKWRVTLARTAVGDDLRTAFTRLQTDLEALREQLRAAGIADQDITVRAVNTQQMYDREGRPSGYRLAQDVLIVSTDLSKLETMAVNPAGLLEKGVVLDNSYVEYHSSKINQLKHDLLAAATQDARLRAEQIAKTAGARMGLLRSARSGVFQIKEPYSASADDYGVYDTSTRHKEITVTVHAEFELR